MDEKIDIKLNIEFVKKQPVFLQLTDEEIHNLAELFTVKRFKAGETIVMEGEPVDSIFLIVKGVADVRHVSMQGEEMIIKSIAKLGEGAAIGLSETGFYSISGVRTATVAADTDMMTLYLSMPKFHGFALAYSHVNEVMHRNPEAYSD